MKKKNIALIFWVIVLITAIGVGAEYLEEIKLKWYKDVEVENYALKISYPRAYMDIEKVESNVEKISPSVTVTENLKVVDDYIPLLVEELIHAKSDLTGLTILVEGIKIEKTEKALEDICKDYITMFKVYNSEETVVDSKYEKVEIDGKEAGRVEIYVRGKTEGVYPGVVAYLISLEDREITIVFSGTKKLLTGNSKEINKIIKSIEIK